MRRRTARILAILAVSLAALAALLYLPGRSSGACRLSRRMVDEAQFARLTEGRAEDPGLISSFQCNGAALSCAGDSYYYSMTEGDPDAMDPVVRALGSGALKLAFARRALDENTLCSGEGLPFIAYTDKAYCAGTLYPTTLPVMSITVTEPDANGSFEIYDRTYRDAQMLLFDNRVGIPDTARIVSSDLKMRIRGNTSAVLPKQSYRLSLFTVSTGNHRRHNDLPLLGMRADEDWILYSGGSDPEHIRNNLSHNLWYQTGAKSNDLGLCVGVECRYVELLLNGQYMGLYTLMYPLDKKAVSLPENGWYYRGLSYEETTPEMLFQAGSETVVGGWELRAPDPSEAGGASCWQCLAEYFDHFFTKGKNTDLDWFEAHIDRKNVIDMHLFLALLIGRDNYYKNNNVIGYPRGDGGWHYLLAPWDLDLTWGQDYSADDEWRTAAELLPPDTKYAPYALPSTRMAELSVTFRRDLLARWRELRAGQWSDEAFSALFDKYEADIYGSGAAARDHARWPDAPHAEDLSQLRAWTQARLVYLDGYYEEVMTK